MNDCCSNKHLSKIRCLMPPGCALNHATKRCIKGSCLTTPPVQGWLKLEILQQHLVHLSAGLSETGVPGVTWHPPILADQLTLSQPGGRLCPTNNTGTPGFSDLPAVLILCEIAIFKFLWLIWNNRVP